MVRNLEENRSYSHDFGSETDALTPDNAISWEKNAESTDTLRGPTRGCPPSFREKQESRGVEV